MSIEAPTGEPLVHIVADHPDDPEFEPFIAAVQQTLNHRDAETPREHREEKMH